MPPQRTTTDELVDALRQAKKPVLDAEGLGEKVDLSAQSIRNRREELESDERVASMKIGRTTVWWYVGPIEERMKQSQVRAVSIPIELVNLVDESYAQYGYESFDEAIKIAILTWLKNPVRLGTETIVKFEDDNEGIPGGIDGVEEPHILDKVIRAIKGFDSDAVETTVGNDEPKT